MSSSEPLYFERNVRNFLRFHCRRQRVSVLLFFSFCALFFLLISNGRVCECVLAGWLVCQNAGIFDCIAFDQAPCVFAYCRVAPWMVCNIHLIYYFFSFIFFVCVPLTDVIVFFFNCQFTFKSNSNFSAVQIKQHFDRRTADAWVSRRALIRTARTKQKHKSSSVVCVCDQSGAGDTGIRVKQNRFRIRLIFSQNELSFVYVCASLNHLSPHLCVCSIFSFFSSTRFDSVS